MAQAQSPPAADGGKLSFATRQARSQLEESLKSKGPEHVDTADQMLVLAGHLRQDGRADDASSLIEAVSRLAAQLNDNRLSLRARMQAALLERDRGDASTARGAARELSATALREVAEDDELLAKCLAAAAHVLLAVGPREEAVSMLDRVATLSRARAWDETLATALVGLALASQTENPARAEDLAREALKIRDRATGDAAAAQAEVLQIIGRLAYERGRYADALEAQLRALSILEVAMGTTHRRTAALLSSLSTTQRALGRLADAEVSALRAQAIFEAESGADSRENGRIYISIGTLRRLQGRHSLAEQSFARGLAVFEKRGDLPDLVYGLTAVSAFYLSAGRYGESEKALLRVMKLAEGRLAPTDRDLIAAGDNLGATYMLLGRYVEAEVLRQRTLELREQVLGTEHRLVAASLWNLGNLYMHTQRPEAAEPLFSRALSIYEKALGPHHMDVGRTLRGVARSVQAQERFAEAEPLLRRALALQDATVGPDHQERAVTALILAQVLRASSRDEEADRLVRQTVASLERTLQPLHPELAMALAQLAAVERRNGDLERANELLTRVLAIRRHSLGQTHWDVAITLQNLALLQRQQGNERDALLAAREASAILRTRATSPATTTEVIARSELRAARTGLEAHLHLLEPGQVRLGFSASAEGLEVAQLARASDTAGSVAQLAARLMAKDNDLAKRVRHLQDLSSTRRFLDSELLKALSLVGMERDQSRIDGLRVELAAASLQVGEARADLERRYPDYPLLVSAAPISVPEVQSLLLPTEALLSFLVTEDVVYAWVIRKAGASAHRLQIGRRQLSELVVTLRGAMKLDEMGRLTPFPSAAAYETYRRLLEPIAPLLLGARHLLVVPDGPLQSLPLALLLTEPSAGRSMQEQWLVKRFAFSTLPSEASLRAFRRVGSKRRAPDAFAGFGAPLFSGGASSLRSGSALYTSRGLADVAQLRQLAPLPETAAEVRTIARVLGAGDDTVFLGAQATESQVKRQDLTRYKTIVFATHALVVGEVHGVAQPALALTPPSTATEEDDGLLSASEVAQLNLNADWVILSACSTAASDGSPRAEALSGLAKAFLFAGARALLVSHWPVDSRAAAQLTTLTFAQLKANPGLRKDEALRRAMLELLQRPQFQHPLFWAPFAFVGADGSSERP